MGVLGSLPALCSKQVAHRGGNSRAASSEEASFLPTTQLAKGWERRDLMANVETQGHWGFVRSSNTECPVRAGRCTASSLRSTQGAVSAPAEERVSQFLHAPSSCPPRVRIGPCPTVPSPPSSSPFSLSPSVTPAARLSPTPRGACGVQVGGSRSLQPHSTALSDLTALRDHMSACSFSHRFSFFLTRIEAMWRQEFCLCLSLLDPYQRILVEFVNNILVCARFFT